MKKHTRALSMQTDTLTTEKQRSKQMPETVSRTHETATGIHWDATYQTRDAHLGVPDNHLARRFVVVSRNLCLPTSRRRCRISSYSPVRCCHVLFSAAMIESNAAPIEPRSPSGGCKSNVRGAALSERARAFPATKPQTKIPKQRTDETIAKQTPQG